MREEVYDLWKLFWLRSKDRGKEWNENFELVLIERNI